MPFIIPGAPPPRPAARRAPGAAGRWGGSFGHAMHPRGCSPSAPTRVMEARGGQVAVQGLELVVTPEQLQLAPGTQALVTLLVTNRGRTVDRFSLRCTGIDPAWFAVPVGEVNLLPDATEAL